MPERQLQEQRNPLICSFLILTGHIKEDVLPAFPPVLRKAPEDSLRSFCQKIKNYIASPAHNVPGFRTPFIRFLKKEVRRQANADHLSALDFIPAGPVFRQRIPCSGRPVYFRSVPVPHLIKIVHIAVLAPFTAANTSVPWIPVITHNRSTRNKVHCFGLPVYFLFRCFTVPVPCCPLRARIR